jgi:hypothetical protein
MRKFDRVKKEKKVEGGIDAVEMKNRIQEKLYEETKNLTPNELIEFYREKAKASRIRKTVPRK